MKVRSPGATLSKVYVFLRLGARVSQCSRKRNAMGPVYDYVPRRDRKSAYVSAARFLGGGRYGRILFEG